MMARSKTGWVFVGLVALAACSRSEALLHPPSPVAAGGRQPMQRPRLGFSSRGGAAGRNKEGLPTTTTTTRMMMMSAAGLLSNAAAPARWPTRRALYAEVVGTLVLTLVGNCVGSAAAYFPATGFGLGTVALAWGGTVAVLSTAAGPTSGAHFNPAVTLANCAFKGMPVTYGLAYSVAQVLGATLSTALTLVAFGPAIAAFEAKRAVRRGTVAGLASAPGILVLPSGLLTPLQACFIEALGTACLLFAIFAISDPAQPKAVSDKTPVYVGTLIAALVCAFAPLTSAGFNPARDLGPRIVAGVAGWGAPAFQHAWLYTVGPFGGALIGALLAKLMF